MRLFGTRNSELGIACAVVLSFGLAQADRGTCGLECDAARISLNEPKQRAIVFWDGSTETLLLSTDLSHSSRLSVREMIPFPAEPEVRSATLGVFEDMAKVMSFKGLNLSSLTAFSERSEMQGLQKNEFQTRQQLIDFLYPRGCTFATNMPVFGAFEDYLNRGFRWVVFDQIEVSEKVHTYPPVEYTFKTDQVYYPLQTSIGNQGMTDVDLVVITPYALNQWSETDFPIQRMGIATVNTAELAYVPDRLLRFPTLQVEHIRIQGDISQMRRDVFAR